MKEPISDRVGRNAEIRPTTAGPEEGPNSATADETRALPVINEPVTIERPQVPKKPIKLEKYDGVSVPFETFAAKLNNAVLYNQWCESEKCAFLRYALVGDASQILWELRPDASSDDIISLLRIRFGNANNAERYRAELSTRKRGVGETTQSVYSDIKRLLSLAFPAQHGEMYEAIGKDYFLNAINDPALRLRVLDRQPKTLDETLAIVTQMEAYFKATFGSGEETPEKRKVRVVSPARESEAEKRIKALAKVIERQNQKIKKIKKQTHKSNQNNVGQRGEKARRTGEFHCASGANYAQSPCANSRYGQGMPNVGQRTYVLSEYGQSQYRPRNVGKPAETGQ